MALFHYAKAKGLKGHLLKQKGHFSVIIAKSWEHVLPITPSPTSLIMDLKFLQLSFRNFKGQTLDRRAVKSGSIMANIHGR